MAASLTPIGIKGKGSKELDPRLDASIIAKASRLRAIKVAMAALEADKKELTASLGESLVERKAEQFTLDGEPVVTADEVEDKRIDYDYLAKRAPVAFSKSQTPTWHLRLNVNPTAKRR